MGRGEELGTRMLQDGGGVVLRQWQVLDPILSLSKFAVPFLSLDLHQLQKNASLRKSTAEQEAYGGELNPVSLLKPPDTHKGGRIELSHQFRVATLHYKKQPFKTIRVQSCRGRSAEVVASVVCPSTDEGLPISRPTSALELQSLCWR